MSPLRLVNRMLSPGGSDGRLAVMIFHRVLPRPDPLQPSEPDAAAFERCLARVRRWFHVLPLEEGAAALALGTLPPRALAITFDDGYADNHDVALPILRRLNLHATFFIATGYLDGGCMFNDVVIETLRRFGGGRLDLSAIGLPALATGNLEERRAAIDALIRDLKYRPLAERSEVARRIAEAAGVATPDDLMMTTAQLRALAREGMGIGAHTHRHPILAKVTAAEAADEIALSKHRLEAIVDRPVRLFAYPNGRPRIDYTEVHVEQVRALGFAAACSTAVGVAVRGSDPLQIPRFTPWDKQPWRFGARLSANLRNRRYEIA